MLWATTTRGQAEPGLAGYWNFDKIIDNQVPDLSGNGNLGHVHGARQVKRGDGYALRFDGQNDYVDCGNGASLNLKKAVTLSVWVYQDARATSEPALVMKDDPEVYGLTVYKDGRCWWYVSGGGNGVKSGLAPGAWHYVVGTYDGQESRLYINGKQMSSRKLAVPIKQGGNFLMAKRGRGAIFFRGMMDEVKVYDRALSADEIKAQYKAAAGGMVAERPVLRDGDILRGKEFLLRIGNNGGLQVEVGGETFFVESSFSYPGKRIGFNHFSAGAVQNEAAWKPVTRSDNGECVIQAAGVHYSITRKVTVKGHRLLISDRIRNTGAQDVGILVNNLMIAQMPEPSVRLSGIPAGASSAAENPTVLIAQKNGQLGMVAEDSISRVQFEARAVMNQAGYALRNLGIAPGKEITLDWTLYPMAHGMDYWAFINRVREDWGVNFTLHGPGTMLSVTSPEYWKIFTHRERCAAWLKRSRIKILALAPWLDYDNLNHQTGRLTSRAEYKELMQTVKRVVKSVDPEVRIIGDIEAPFVSLPRDVVKSIYNSLPANKRKGYHEFTPAQTKMLQANPAAWAQWSDSAVITRKGNMQFESYSRGKYPMIALTVRHILLNDTQTRLTPNLTGPFNHGNANGQHRYLMEQANFIIEECGLDGFYVDSFTGSKHWHYGYGYDRWDGTTVDIDASTGKITAKYTDLALACTESRREFMQYGLDKGGVVVTNGHPIARETQAMEVHRFNESEWVVDVYATPADEKPPLHARVCEAHLASPLALGVRPHRYGAQRGSEKYAEIVMRTAIHYLRHGVLYYHYGTYIPESGPGSGEHGPINHMFPITPVRLGPGFVEGKERVVSCVSGTFISQRPQAPRILLFDINGRPKAHQLTASRAKTGWTVNIKLADWQEIAIIE